MWFVYILKRLDPPKGCRRLTYTGKTNNVHRRLREHNGEIKGGAKYTRGGKWKVKYLFGNFPDETTALQFEYTFKRKYKSAPGTMVLSNDVLMCHVNDQLDALGAKASSAATNVVKRGLITMFKDRFTKKAVNTSSLDIFVVANPDVRQYVGESRKKKVRNK